MDFAAVGCIFLSIVRATNRLSLGMVSEFLTRYGLNTTFSLGLDKENNNTNTKLDNIGTQNTVEMHLHNLIVSNLVQKSGVLNSMVEDSDFNQCYCTEGGYTFTYRQYDDLSLESIINGFQVTFDELVYIAFGVLHEDALVAADKLDCRDYLFMLLDKWIMDDAPWEPGMIAEKEIMINNELLHRWIRKMEHCVKRGEVESVRRLWLSNYPQYSDLWKFVSDVHTADVFIENRILPTPKTVCGFIKSGNCEVLDVLLEDGLVDANGMIGRKTFLMAACLAHKSSVVSTLLFHGADPQLSVNGLSPLSCAETERYGYKIYNILLRAIDAVQTQRAVMVTAG